ncbi:MAG: CpsD/CapB family tyrosine-protein kinase [Streptococcaceae bacterium]|jgi:Mrp family chromosome partitioning ATPase|nr:CpsD/CapB family tyrosine-protein kinase [Streptococcaceae bacterium]
MRISQETKISEQYYTLGTNLEYALEDHPEQKVVMFGATGNSDMTTDLVVNLAMLNAQKGKRTLIIDSNFQDSKLQKRYGTAGDKGWTDLLANSVTPTAVIKENVIPNLSIIPIGQKAAEPLVLMSQSNGREIISNLKAQYDMIFLNASPFFTTDEPTLLLQLVDAVALVVVAGETQQQELLAMINAVRLSHTNILGLIEWVKG